MATKGIRASASISISICERIKRCAQKLKVLRSTFNTFHKFFLDIYLKHFALKPYKFFFTRAEDISILQLSFHHIPPLQSPYCSNKEQKKNFKRAALLWLSAKSLTSCVVKCLKQIMES